MIFSEKQIDLDKMQSLLEVLKTFKFAATNLPYKSSLGLEWVVTSIKEHVISGLTHLACFTSVKLAAHTKCWKGSLCMDYEAKFTEVKEAR